MKIISGSLRNKIIALTALTLICCIASAIILETRAQQKLDRIKSRDVCTIYKNVLRSNDLFHVQKMEKSFKRLTNLPELSAIAKGDKSDNIRIILQGMFISLTKVCNISHLIILDSSENIIFTEQSKGATVCPADMFKTPLNKNLLKTAVSSSMFESRTLAMDGKPYLLGVTAVADDDDQIICYLGGLIPPESLTESFSKAVNATVAFQGIDGKIICSSNPLIYKSIPEYTLKNTKSDTYTITKTSSGVFLSYVSDILDHDQIAGRFWISTDYQEGNQIMQSTKITLYSSIATTVIASLLIIYLLLTQIIRPVKAVESILKKIADGEGDLTRRIRIKSQDEIGRMSQWFNLFVEKVQNIVTQIALNADKVLNSTEALHSSAETISTKTADVSMQSDHVTAIIKSATQQISAISTTTSNMSLSVNALASAIDQINSSLSEVARNSKKESQIASDAEEHVLETKLKIDELGKASKEIGTIVEVISDIAALTNLLSINATIEAATAGAAGKGFVIVAGEIKDLAKQTASATKDIEQRVLHMQEITNISIKSIESFSAIVSEVNAISRTISIAIEEQSETIAAIANTISNVSGSAGSIADNVKQTVTDLQDVDFRITAVNNGTSEAAAGISEINMNIANLNELSQELRAMVTQFKH